MQATAPITMVSRARLGAPAVRMKLLMPMPTICAMQPIERIHT